MQQQYYASTLRRFHIFSFAFSLLIAAALPTMAQEPEKGQSPQAQKPISQVDLRQQQEKDQPFKTEEELRQYQKDAMRKARIDALNERNRQEQAQYAECLELAERNPPVARRKAIDWQTNGGGIPAQHCLALAYAHAGDHASSADELAQMAVAFKQAKKLKDGTLEPYDAQLLSEIYMQAGNAWLLAEQNSRAYQAFSQGLVENPVESSLRPDLFIDRARASAAASDYDTALADLKAAQAITPKRVDLLVLMATAYRALEQYEAAEPLLEQALSIAPYHEEGLLERGNLSLIKGEKDIARQSWLEVIRLYPDSISANAARQNLEKLDLKIPQ